MTQVKPEYSAAVNPIGARLKSEMKKRELNSSELAKKADVLTSFLYDIMSGKSANPSTVKLARVAEALDISLNYLVTGAAGSNDNLSPDIATSECSSLPHISCENGNITTRHDETMPMNFSLAWLSQTLHTRIEDARLYKINDDSMQPSLQPNDMVLLDVSRRIPTPAGLFLVHDGLGLAVKRLEYISHPAPHIRVISDNALYASYERLPDELSIVGRVVWLSRSL